jgi:hypothetical protein
LLPLLVSPLGPVLVENGDVLEAGDPTFDWVNDDVPLATNGELDPGAC